PISRLTERRSTRRRLQRNASAVRASTVRPVQSVDQRLCHMPVLLSMTANHFLVFANEHCPGSATSPARDGIQNRESVIRCVCYGKKSRPPLRRSSGLSLICRSESHRQKSSQGTSPHYEAA